MFTLNIAELTDIGSEGSVVLYFTFKSGPFTTSAPGSGSTFTTSELSTRIVTSVVQFISSPLFWSLNLPAGPPTLRCNSLGSTVCPQNKGGRPHKRESKAEH